MSVNEKNRNENQVKIKRIQGYLHRVIPIFDEAGRVISHSLQPFMVELRPRDLLQIVVGSTILGIPVGLTEEVWELGRTLPVNNIIIIAALSFLFISLFVYFNFYRYVIREHFIEYVKRIVATYLLTLAVIGIYLTLIEKCPWSADPLLAVKRVVLVALPASMSAMVTDGLK